MAEHTCELFELLAKLETNIETGLTNAIVERNLKRDGLNCIKPREEDVKNPEIFNTDYFKKLVPDEATVLREGKTFNIKAENLVVGDIVILKAGDRIPADVRIVKSNEFEVDMSTLTGESGPAMRNSKCSSDNPLETTNLAFLSTVAVEGDAVGIVIKIGNDTICGGTAHLASVLE